MRKTSSTEQTTMSGNGVDQTEVPPSAAGFFNDLAALRQAYAVPQEEAGIVAAIEPRKPETGVWFRTHSSPEYYMPGRIIVDREDRSTAYLLSPHLIGKFPDDEKPVLLIPYITRHGVVGIWPAGIGAGARGGGRGWINSRVYAIESAKLKWVKIYGEANGYRVVPAESDFGEPKWPDLTFPQMLEIAWCGLIINSEDHDVIQRVVLGRK
jgi:hypothetical protein